MAEQIGLQGVFDLKNFDSGVDSYIKRTKEAEGATDKAAGSLTKGWDQMGKSVLGATNIMGKALVGATAAATAAVGAFVVSGIKGAATLEAQLSTVASVLGVTTEAVGPLKEAVYDLALNPNLKVGVDEAAAAMEMLARNGLSMDQILGGAAEATVLLANATKADFATAADIGTDAMAIFGIEAKDMMQAVDGIVSVTNNSKFSIEDYGFALAQGGAVAKAAGVEFEDFNTTIAATASNFGKGGDAGTAFKFFVTTLIPKSKEAGEKMAELGMTSVNTGEALDFLANKGVKPVQGDMWDLYNQVVDVYYAANDLEVGSAEAAEQFSNWARETGLIQSSFFDANGQLKDMGDIAVILNEKLAGLSEVQRNTALSTIFGSDASRTAIGLMEAGEVVYTDLAVAARELGMSQDELREYIEGGITAFEIQQAKMRQTDALKNAQTNTDNFKSALSILTDTIDAISRRIGDLFLPMLKNLALGLNEMVSAAGPAIIQFFDDMLNGLMAVGNYFAIVIQDGDALNDWLTHLPDGMRDTVQLIGETIAGIAQTLTAFREGTLGADYPWFEVFPPSIAPVAMFLAGAIQFVSQNMEAFKGAIAGVGALLAGAAISQALTGIAAAIAAINLPLVALIASAALVGAAWNANWFGIRDTTLEVLAALQAAFGPLLDTIMQFGGEALTEIMAFVQGTGTEFSALTTITQAIGAAFTELFNGIGPAAMVALTAVQDWAVQIAGAIADNYPAIVASVYNYGAALVEWIADAAPLAIVAVGDYIAGLITWLAGDGQSQITASTGPLVAALLEWITNDLIPQVGPAMARFGLALGSAILEIAKALGTAALAIGVAIINAILGTDWASTGGAVLTLLQVGFESAKGGIIAAALEVGTRLRAAFEGIDWAATGQAILDGIKDGIERARAILTETATAIIQGLRTAFLSSGVNWGDIGQTVINGIRTGLDAAKGALETAANSVATALKDYFSENRQGWTESGRGIMANIRTGFESAKTAFLDAISNIAATAKAAFESVDWAAVGRELLLAVGRGLGASVGLFILGIAAIVEVAQQAFLVDWGAVGESILAGIRAGVDAVKATFAAYFGEIATETGSAFTAIDWKALGSLILNSIQTGIGLVKQGFIDGVNLVAGDVLKQFTNIKWAELGQNIITWITGGITKAANGLVNAASEIATNALNAFSDIDWVGVGKAIIDGIISGINSAGDAISDKLTSLAEDAWDAVKDTLGISSPSRVFAEIGRNIVEGLIVGIDDRAGALRSTMASLAEMTFAPGQFAGALSIFGEYASVFKTFSGAANDAEKDLADLLASTQQDVQNRSKLLELFRKLKLDPATFFGGNFATASAGQITALLKTAADRTLTDIRAALQDAADRLPREFALDTLLAPLAAQTKQLSGLLSRGLTGFLKTAADRLKAQVDDVDKRLAEAQAAFLASGDERDRAAIQSLIQARSSLISELRNVTDQDSYLDRLYGDTDAITSALQTQLKLIRDAKAVGVGLGAMGILGGEMSLDDLKRFAALQAEIASRQAQDLRKEIASELYLGDLSAGLENLTGAAATYKSKVLDPLLSRLKDVVLMESTRNALLAAFQDKVKRIFAVQEQQEALTSMAERLTELANRTFTGFFQTAADRLRAQIDDVDKRLEAAQSAFLHSGLERDRLAAEALIDERASLIAKLGGIAARGDFLTRMYGDTAAITAALNEQLDLIRQAKAAGVGLGDMGILSSAMTQEELLRLGDIQAQVARKQAEALRKEIAGELYLSELGTGLEDLTGAAATYKSRFIDPLVTRLRESVLIESTRNELLEEYRKRAQEALKLQTQQNRLEQIAVQLSGQLPAAAQYYKEQVLDPILTRLREQVLLEEERNRLTTQYQAGAQKLLQIQRQQAQLDFLNQQLDLIKQVNDEGLDPSKIFAGITLGWDATAEGLATAAGRVVDALILNVSGEIGRALQVVARNEEELARQMELGKLLAGFNAQNNTIKSVAGNFFSSFFQTAETKIRAGIAKIDEQLTTLRGQFLRTGDALFGDRIKALISQRQTLVTDLRNLGDQDYFLKYFAGGDPSEIQGVLSDQLKLIQDAKRLGVALGDMQPLAKDFGIGDLTKLGILEGMVANKQTEELRRQIAEALFIGDLGNAGNGLTGPAAIYKAKVLDPIMAQLRASVLNEAERVRLIAKYNEEARKAQAIQAQQNIVDKLAAQLGGNMPALGQRYQTQVLDPILAKLREQVLTEAERNRLSEEYRKGQEKLLQLQREQSKLDFLKEQLDLIKLVKDNELDASWVFQGLTLGINASISDLLAATTRAVQAMIAQVQGDLRIDSPSKVFMDIGKQVMAGLARGIDSNVVRPMSSLQRAIEVPRGSVSNRSLNLSFGGVTISNGMDLATFETRVQRIMESSLA